ncbi:MAG TPA: hypothetical protein VGI85_08175 [Chthoniobacterales bacterium]
MIIMSYFNYTEGLEEKPGVGNRRRIVDNVDGQNERYDAAHARFLITPEQLEIPSEFYPPAARIALNVPLFGLSPTRGENSTWPVIKLGVSNLPLNANVPASRPTLPIGNSTAPENVTAFPSP